MQRGSCKTLRSGTIKRIGAEKGDSSLNTSLPVKVITIFMPDYGKSETSAVQQGGLPMPKCKNCGKQISFFQNTVLMEVVPNVGLRY
jgi:hypothetical protein